MKMRSIIAGLLLALATPLAAFAQCSGQAPSLTYCGNPTGALALPGWKPISTIVVPAPLSKADDANVTLTLTGTPATSLLQAVQIAAGWSGQLAATRGGTGIGTFVVGDLLYANTTTSLARLADVATGNVLKAGGVGVAPLWGKVTASEITAAALTKVDDTNVTLTLGGAPATALVNAASLTLGWAGQLSLARGGTNAALTASTGGIIYSGASAFAVLSGTATARQMLQSGASAAPAWSTATWPATTAANQLLYSSATNTVAGLATAASGVLVTDVSGVPSISSTLPAHSFGGAVNGGGFALTNTLISGAANTLSNIGNASLTNSATTVNGQTCTLGAACTVTATATATLTFGAHLTSGGSSYNGSTAITITSDATALNTVSTIMARDGSGQVAATTFTGALAGNATTASTATNAINTGITDDTTTNATVFPTWVTASTGNLPQKTSSTKLSFNPSTGTLTSTNFAGGGAGLTGTASGFTAGNVTNNANLTGDVTSVGNATTLTNAPVIAKVLTGFTSGAGAVTSADSILSAFQKLNGNDALKLPLAGGTMSGNIAMGGNAISGAGPITGTTITGTTYVGLPTATGAVLGLVRPDGTTISISAGVISAVGGVATSVQPGTTTVTGGTNGSCLGTGGSSLMNQIACVSSGGSAITLTSSGATANVEQTAPGGRLTLASGVPVMAASQTAATTLFYAPYKGKYVPLYTSGVGMRLLPFTASDTDAVGLSLALGSSWVTGANYDAYGYVNGAAVGLCTSPDWSAGAVAGSNAVTASVRGTGAGSAEQQLFKGFQTNKNTMTCRTGNASTVSCAVNECTYLGTFRTGAAGQISFTYGASGVAGTFNLWNAYNQEPFCSISSDPGSGGVWSYTSATIRQANANPVNQFNFVTGAAGSSIDAAYTVAARSAVLGAQVNVGTNINSTTSIAVGATFLSPGTTNFDITFATPGSYKGVLGANYVSANEAGDGTNTILFIGFGAVNLQALRACMSM